VARPQASAAWLETRIRELYADGLAWRPGARELLAAVRAKGIPSALVTATRRSLVEAVLGTPTAAEADFDVVICGDDVEHTKPHPQPYLAAADRLGIEPGRCIAVEDSPTGIASARAAGCIVVSVPREAALTTPRDVIIVEGLELLDIAMMRRLASLNNAVRLASPTEGI
jgi:HAD superfamily hydrolase (TIGR01509 family)